MAAKLAFIHAISSLHAGTGQGVGVIDLPIAREKATNLPIVPGSSIKGCLRDTYQGHPDEDAIFGPKVGDKGDQKFAGALHISDARLLLLPVRCLGTSFVWTTCPYLLRRLCRDAQAAGLAQPDAAIPALKDEQAQVSSQEILVQVEKGERLILEDLDFVASEGNSAAWADWIASRLFPGEDAWSTEMKKRFAIIDDNSFHFLAEFGTEVNAHVKIDDKTQTVESGALWYQESLPAETVLVSIVHSEKSRLPGSNLSAQQILDTVKTRFLQLGGKATTGHGVARFVPGEAA